MPRNFPAVLIIFTGRVGAGNPPLPTVRGGAGNPPLPAGRVPRGAGRPSLDIRTLRSRQHGLGVVEEDTHFVVVVVNDDDIDSGGGDGRKYSGYWDTLVWGARWGPRP